VDWGVRAIAQCVGLRGAIILAAQRSELSGFLSQFRELVDIVMEIISMSYQLSRKDELRNTLKDEYCDLQRIESHFGQDCGIALAYITQAKKSIAEALQCLGGTIPDCNTWVNPLKAEHTTNSSR
jgi:hydrogenase maturation factor HypF (carbamoyltransferase family)